MAPIRAHGDRRLHPRRRVSVVVTWCKQDQELMIGELCDVSLQGVFLLSRTALPDGVGVGDRTKITVRTAYAEEDLVGTVRWRGYHPAHQAIGCGIKLDDSSRRAILRLFPELQLGSLSGS
jgi:hypothetical protein